MPDKINNLQEVEDKQEHQVITFQLSLNHTKNKNKR